MEKIRNITIFNDGDINIKVECGKCGNINIHTITQASNKTDDNHIIIDFSKLGERYCDGVMNFKDPIRTRCGNKYKIYQ